MTDKIVGDSQECVGCGACSNVCPKSAISMKYDKYGFLCPNIDENKCISCGLCASICQVHNDLPLQKDFVQHGYIAISRNKRLYRNAASGGAFTTIANAFLVKNEFASVSGATYENGKVSHIVIDKKEELNRLQNSKYVQSCLNTIYIEINKMLDDGKKVLFSGTPCQVYALKRFLKKNYDNLYTIDIICHGVPSPLFLERDLRQYGNKVSDVCFRTKNRLFKSKSGFILSFTVDGKKKYVLSNRDAFFSLFMSSKSFRPSCYQCRFANMNRVGDITIGDCDSHSEYLNFHPKEATSTVIINSDKGERIWDIVKDDFDYQVLDLEKEERKNTQLLHPSEKPENLGEILSETMDMDLLEITAKYAKPNDLKSKILLIKSLLLP